MNQIPMPNGVGSRRLSPLLAALAALSLAGCAASSGIPGVPDVKFEVVDTAAQAACKQFARAIIDNTTREGMTADVDAARATAAADTMDAGAKRVASAVEQFLIASVAGTPESFDAATNEVIASCESAGVTITVE